MTQLLLATILNFNNRSQCGKLNSQHYSNVMSYLSHVWYYLFIALIAFFLSAVSCKTKVPSRTNSEVIEGVDQNNFPTKPLELDRFEFLKQCMTGTFSSRDQSKNDSDFFDIQLRMVPIWEKSANVFYLYVEQAVANSLDKPYRQRVYKVVKDDDTHFTSYIYTLPETEKFVGKNEGDAVFATIDQEIIIEKNGCEVRLVFDPNKNTFSGSTGEKTCPSERAGASWATSKVSIMDGMMISWDQGWDDKGQQVWGAVKSGYIFKKCY